MITPQIGDETLPRQGEAILKAWVFVAGTAGGGNFASENIAPVAGCVPGVFRMAVRTCRRVNRASRQRLSMNTSQVLAGDSRMTVHTYLDHEHLVGCGDSGDRWSHDMCAVAYLACGESPDRFFRGGLVDRRL
jgi:hypothetical protein